MNLLENSLWYVTIGPRSSVLCSTISGNKCLKFSNIYCHFPFLVQRAKRESFKKREPVSNTVACRPLKIYAGKCFDIYKAHLITTGGVG